MSSQPGFVYIARLAGLDLYKIGTTSIEPARRVYQLDRCMPFPVELVAAQRVADGHYFEGLLHNEVELHGGCLVRCEWYQLDEVGARAVVARLAAMRDETAEQTYAAYCKALATAAEACADSKQRVAERLAAQLDALVVGGIDDR